MEYISTRGGVPPVSGARAVLEGLAPDGGLYAPRAFKRFSAAEISAMRDMRYGAMALEVLSSFFDEFSREELARAIDGAYSRFDGEGVAPLRALSGGLYAMELYHGPTLAFKDVALTLLPRLMTASARVEGETREVLVLAATSGDTGKAALAGFADVPGARCVVFYPKGGVARAQELQMITQEGANVGVIAVHGNFDDAQRGVKRIFADTGAAEAFSRRGLVLSSANSINFGRLAPQIVYYFSAYARLMALGAISAGEEVDFAVPTGNFGDILAGYYAKRMGLPVGALICASNANNVLADFFATGVYNARRQLARTTSPSMDILVSSNLERFLFELSGRDSLKVRDMMARLKRDGKYEADFADSWRDLILSGWTDDEGCAEEMSRVFEDEGYLIDPHTAVAMKVARERRDSARPCVVVSTASPYKFSRAVAGALGIEGEDEFELCRALAARAGQEVPPAIAELAGKRVRHTAECEPEGMADALLKAVI